MSEFIHEQPAKINSVIATVNGTPSTTVNVWKATGRTWLGERPIQMVTFTINVNVGSLGLNSGKIIFLHTNGNDFCHGNLDFVSKDGNTENWKWSIGFSEVVDANGGWQAGVPNVPFGIYHIKSISVTDNIIEGYEMNTSALKAAGFDYRVTTVSVPL
jgi:hypothetical protein